MFFLLLNADGVFAPENRYLDYFKKLKSSVDDFYNFLTEPDFFNFLGACSGFSFVFWTPCCSFTVGSHQLSFKVKASFGFFFKLDSDRLQFDFNLVQWRLEDGSSLEFEKFKVKIFKIWDERNLKLSLASTSDFLSAATKFCDIWISTAATNFFLTLLATIYFFHWQTKQLFVN